MSDITDIVNRLNAPPFSKRLRLVDFHDMPRSELLGVLGEVLCAIDPRQPRGEALREEKEDAMVARISGFLLMCKFPLPPVGTDSSDAFAAGLSEGDPAAIHPILQWLLQRVPQLQKRAYLARFLMPVEIPAEFTQDVALMELLGTYRELQSEFKRVHKAVESMRDNDLRPGELKSDMTQLEEERSQLKEKIARLKRNAANEPGFDEMLEVTTRLRAAQEEESRLAIKMHQQRAALLMTEQRLEQGSQKLQQLRASASGGASAEAVLLQLRSEVDALSIRAGRDLPREITNKLRVLRKLQRSQAEPPRTREDAEDLSAALSAMERDNEAARETAERGLAARADSNIMMFRQQAALAAKKLEERIAQAENLALEREGLAEEAELLAAAAEASMSMTAGNSGGLMSREELKAYGSRLREKTLVYKRLKAELAALRAETVVIGRTEQVLRSRDDRLEDFLSELEDRRGVGGYRQAQAELVERSEAAAAADSGKAQTLQEISNLVNVITKELQGRKADLQEQVAALKRARAEVAELEGTHGAAQAKYDQLAVGFEVERQSIEAECDRLQEEALAEESRYHSLSSLNSILSAQLARVKQEEAWKSGEGRLLPDFRCYKDLYEHKLRQQESLSKQLRRQQKSIREKEGGNTVQRKLFDDLHSLLHGKMAVKKLQVVAANKRKDHIDEAFIKTIDAQYGGGGAGGANVLTL